LRNYLSVSEKITVDAIKYFCFIRLGLPLKHPYFFIKQYHAVLIFPVWKLSKQSLRKSSHFFMPAVDFVFHEHNYVYGKIPS